MMAMVLSGVVAKREHDASTRGMDFVSKSIKIEIESRFHVHVCFNLEAKQKPAVYGMMTTD